MIRQVILASIILCLSISVKTQNDTMYVHHEGSITKFVVSEVDSIIFYATNPTNTTNDDEVRVPPTIPQIDESDYTVYYVDTLGDDNNSGLSEDEPIKTLSKAGVLARSSNAKILFKSGQTFKGLLWLGSLKSTADKPLIIDSYGGDVRPTIDGEGSSNGSAITLRDDNVRIRNIRVTNKTGRLGISIDPINTGAFENIEITGCRIEEVNWLGEDILPENPSSLDVEAICSETDYNHNYGGIVFIAKTPVEDGACWFENIYITNNELYKVSRTGIWFNTYWGKRPGTGWGYNTYVNDSTGWYPSKNIVVQGNDLSYIGGSGIVVIASLNSFIDHNKVFHASYLARKGTGNAGIWPHSSIDFTMQYNEVAYTHKEFGSGDGEGLDVDIACSNTLVQYNYSHHNDGGGILICNNKSDDGLGNHNGTIIRNNVFYDNWKDTTNGDFMTASSAVKNVEIYNNLIVSTDRRSDVKLVESVNWSGAGINENFTFRNNVFVATHPINARFDLDMILNCKFENNLYYQIGDHSSLDSELLDYNPLLTIPAVLDGYENGLKFKLQEPKVFTDGLLFPSMSVIDMEGNNAEGVKYLGPFSE